MSDLPEGGLWKCEGCGDQYTLLANYSKHIQKCKLLAQLVRRRLLADEAERSPSVPWNLTASDKEFLRTNRIKVDE